MLSCLSQIGSDALAVWPAAVALMLGSDPLAVWPAHTHSDRPPWREVAGAVSVGTWQPRSSSWRWSVPSQRIQHQRSIMAAGEEELLRALELLATAPTDALLHVRSRLSTPEQISTCWAIIAAQKTTVSSLHAPVTIPQGSLLCNVFWVITLARLVVLTSTDCLMELYRCLQEDAWPGPAEHASDSWMMMNLARRLVWSRMGRTGLECLGQGDRPHDEPMSPAAVQTLTAMRWLAATPAVLIAAAERAACDNDMIQGPDHHIAGFLHDHVLPWNQMPRWEHQNSLFNGWRTTPARGTQIPSISGGRHEGKGRWREQLRCCEAPS